MAEESMVHSRGKKKAQVGIARGQMWLKMVRTRPCTAQTAMVRKQKSKENAWMPLQQGRGRTMM